jgi:hypothetical protein
VLTKRRAVLHAAWAVPAVIAVSAAPALALSAPIQIVSFGGSCKYPGQSVPGKEYGYHMVVTFNSNGPGIVTIDNFIIGGAPTTDITPKTFPITAGNTVTAFDVFSSNSAQRDAVITYTFTPTGGQPGTYTAGVTFAGFPPCK